MLKVILNRIYKPHIREITAEEKIEFRAEQSTKGQIFDLRLFCVKRTYNSSRICTMSILISKKPLTRVAAWHMAKWATMWRNIIIANLVGTI